MGCLRQLVKERNDQQRRAQEQEQEKRVSWKKVSVSSDDGEVQLVKKGKRLWVRRCRSGELVQYVPLSA